MPRKYGDRAGWARILASTFTVARVETPAFHGVASLYTMLRVRERLYKPVCGELTLIADDGFRWLQLYSADPACQTYTVTAAFDSEKILAQWYIDVCAGHGVDRTGVPWHDDLYLDVIANGRGAVEVIDAADLEAAIAAAIVGDAEYQLAWREAHRLAPLVRSASLPEMRFAGEALDALETLGRGGAVVGFTVIAGVRTDAPETAR
jgi:predicted RNA-binding protein associated with RNAse of E/G family